MGEGPDARPITAKALSFYQLSRNGWPMIFVAPTLLVTVPDSSPPCPTAAPRIAFARHAVELQPVRIGQPVPHGFSFVKPLIGSAV